MIVDAFGRWWLFQRDSPEHLVCYDSDGTLLGSVDDGTGTPVSLSTLQTTQACLSVSADGLEVRVSRMDQLFATVDAATGEFTPLDAFVDSLRDYFEGYAPESVVRMPGIGVVAEAPFGQSTYEARTLVAISTGGAIRGTFARSEVGADSTNNVSIQRVQFDPRTERLWATIQRYDVSDAFMYEFDSSLNVVSVTQLNVGVAYASAPSLQPYMPDVSSPGVTVFDDFARAREIARVGAGAPTPSLLDPSGGGNGSVFAVFEGDVGTQTPIVYNPTAPGDPFTAPNGDPIATYTGTALDSYNGPKLLATDSAEFATDLTFPPPPDGGALPPPSGGGAPTIMVMNEVGDLLVMRINGSYYTGSGMPLRTTSEGALVLVWGEFVTSGGGGGIA